MNKLILLTTLLVVPNQGALLHRKSSNEGTSGQQLFNSMSDSMKGALNTTNSVLASVFGIDLDQMELFFGKAASDIDTEDDFITALSPESPDRDDKDEEELLFRSSNTNKNDKKGDQADELAGEKPNNNKNALLLDLTLKTEKLLKKIKESFSNLIKVSNKLNGSGDKDLTKSKLKLVKATENSLSDITQNLSELVAVASKSLHQGTEVLAAQNMIIEKTGESLQKVIEVTTNMLTEIEESNLYDSNNKNGMAARMIFLASDKIAALTKFSKMLTEALIRLEKLKGGNSNQNNDENQGEKETTTTAATTTTAGSPTTAGPSSEPSATTTRPTDATTTTATTTAATTIAPAS